MESLKLAGVREAVHRLRRHHENLDRALKLVAASLLHLEEADTVDEAVVAKLIARASPIWSEARHSKTWLPATGAFVATASLVSALASFEEFAEELALGTDKSASWRTGLEENPKTRAGWIAMEIAVNRAPSSALLPVARLLDYFGEVRNRIAHPAGDLSPDERTLAAYVTYRGTKGKKRVPELPRPPSQLTFEQAIFGSSLCLEMAKAMVSVAG